MGIGLGEWGMAPNALVLGRLWVHDRAAGGAGERGCEVVHGGARRWRKLSPGQATRIYLV